MTGMLSWHLYLACTGQTSVEYRGNKFRGGLLQTEDGRAWAEWKQQTHLLELGGESPYHRGWSVTKSLLLPKKRNFRAKKSVFSCRRENLARVFGTSNVVLALLPSLREPGHPWGGSDDGAELL